MSNAVRNGDADGPSREGSASQQPTPAPAPGAGAPLHAPAVGADEGGAPLTGEGGNCEHCEEPMSLAEPVVNYEGRLWHPSCFV